MGIAGEPRKRGIDRVVVVAIPEKTNSHTGMAIPESIVVDIAAISRVIETRRHPVEIRDHRGRTLEARKTGHSHVTVRKITTASIRMQSSQIRLNNRCPPGLK